MATVTFSPLGLRAETLEHETLLDGARRAGAPLGNACGGVGICGRCRVAVISGELSPMTTIEKRVTGERQFSEDERLACQAVVKGDCSVTARYWGSKR